ncbi:hypothetical protein J7K50_06775 [bacterium]|nr:hypothetical protein [bacterium]
MKTEGDRQKNVLVIGAGPVGRLVILDFLMRREGRENARETRIFWLVRDGIARAKLAENGLIARPARGVQEMSGFHPENAEIAGPESAHGNDARHFSLDGDSDIVLASSEDIWQDSSDSVSFDAVIVCVKAHSLMPLIAEIREHWPDAPILAVANGLIESDDFFLGILFGGARIIRDTLYYTDAPQITWGKAVPASGGARAAFNQRAAHLFSHLLEGDGLIRYRHSADMHRAMLAKVIVNAVINPLTALSGAPNEIILESELRPLVVKLVNETCGVLNAAYPDYHFNRETEIERVLDVARSTAPNISSMLQDMRAGRVTEISWLNGKITELAEKFNIKAPLNSWLAGVIGLIGDAYGK